MSFCRRSMRHVLRWRARSEREQSRFLPIALVAELADAHGSGPCGGNPLEVRILSRAIFSDRRGGDMLHAIHRASTPGSRKILRSVAVRSCQTLWRLPLTHGPEHFPRGAKLLLGSLSSLCRLRCARRKSMQQALVVVVAIALFDRVFHSTNNLLARFGLASASLPGRKYAYEKSEDRETFPIPARTITKVRWP